MSVESEYPLLIADDERHVCVLLQAIAQAAGFTVVGTASNGDQALELYRQKLPDLLVLDVNMPVKTGDEVLREIFSEYPEANVVMLTAVADEETVGLCIDLGASNYIRKDTRPGQIRQVLLDAVQS